MFVDCCNLPGQSKIYGSFSWCWNVDNHFRDQTSSLNPGRPDCSRPPWPFRGGLSFKDFFFLFFCFFELCVIYYYSYLETLGLPLSESLCMVFISSKRRVSWIWILHSAALCSACLCLLLCNTTDHKSWVSECKQKERRGLHFFISCLATVSLHLILY